MSGPDIERSGGCDGGGGDGGDDDEDGVISPSRKDGLKDDGAQNCERESKRVFVFRFGKSKKKLQVMHSRTCRRRKRRRKGGVANSGCFGRWGDRMVGCCLCDKQPQTLDSSGESPVSDPNSKEFTSDTLKVFIEKNDFYAKECNPHLDSN